MANLKGRINLKWKLLGGDKGPLGPPITRNIKLPVGEIKFFKYGCLWMGKSTGKVYYADLHYPLLGNPIIIANKKASLIFNIVTSRHKIAGLSKRQSTPSNLDLRILKSVLKLSFFLKPVGEKLIKSNLIQLEITSQSAKGLRVSLTNQNLNNLKNRSLYDIIMKLPNGKFHELSPHSVYVTDTSWKNFSFIHATDVHIAKGVDQIHNKIKMLAKNHSGLKDGLKYYHNWNDNFCNFIKYANRLHKGKKLDLIIATGDLVDYLYERGDKKHYKGGNFAFFKSLILGEGKFSDGKISREELRVPIFTTLGNHDYRANPYRLIAKIVLTLNAAVKSVLKKMFPGIGSFAGNLVGGVLNVIGIGGASTDKISKDLDQYADYNLTKKEAKILEGGKRVTLKTEAGGKMLEVDKGMVKQTAYYFKEINRSASYSINLGDNNIIMVDTKYDSGITSDPIDIGLAKFIGLGSSERKKFVNGFINSEGFNTSELRLVKNVLSKTKGSVIVGMHAPPLCHSGGTFSHFFRETEHRKAPKSDTIDFLLRNGGIYPFMMPLTKESVMMLTGTGTSVTKKRLKDIKPRQIRGWRMDQTRFFRKAKKLDDSLAKGVADNSDKFLSLCVGANGGKKVDLVLCGHKHRNAQYKLKWNKKEFEYYMDFYTENPKRYYNSNEFAAGENDVITKINSSIKTPGKLVRKRDHRPESGPIEIWSRDIPQFNQSLDKSRNATIWWKNNKPLVLLTPSLGPIDKNQRPKENRNENFKIDYPLEPAFQGIRLINVKNNVIQSIKIVSHDEIKKKPKKRNLTITGSNFAINLVNRNVR